MELKRYKGIDYIEYEGVQITPENMKEIADHFRLEYVEKHMTDDGVEAVLFRPGHFFPLHVGDFVVQSAFGPQQAYAILAGDFSSYYKEIEIHVYVPKTMTSDMDYQSPCVFCDNARHEAPYHRDPVAGETVTLPGGGSLTFRIN